jgi:GTP-binding protein EngB required for normal cell division
MTKKDKVKNQSDFFKTQDQVLKEIKNHPACYPEIICTSAQKKEGIEELKQTISKLVL